MTSPDQPSAGDLMPQLGAVQQDLVVAAGWAQDVVARYELDDEVEFDTGDIYSDHGFDDGDIVAAHASALRDERGGAYHLQDFMSSHVLLWYVWQHLVAPQVPGTAQVPVGYFSTLHNPVGATVDAGGAAATLVKVSSVDIVELGAQVFAGHGSGWCAMFSLVYRTIHLAHWYDTWEHVNALSVLWDDWQLALAADLAQGRLCPQMGDVIKQALIETMLVAAPTASSAQTRTVGT